MRKKSAGLLSLVVAAGLGTTLGMPAVSATPAPTVKSVATSADKPDESAGHELPNPLEDKRRALRQEAINELLSGKGKVEKRGASTVMKVSSGRSPKSVDKQGNAQTTVSSEDQYVELSREKTDKIFVVLADFGNERSPELPRQGHRAVDPRPDDLQRPAEQHDPAAEPRGRQQHRLAAELRPGALPGPLLRPGRHRRRRRGPGVGQAVLRAPVLRALQHRRHGHQLGEGAYNEARYGRSSDDPANGTTRPCARATSAATPGTSSRTRSNQWVADQKAAGRTTADITAELKTFDQWDRYDADGDGNFNEPDGYLDHFQIVHAGGDEADGDPIQGEDAIWSHRWYTQTTPIGTGGPNGYGGSQIGDTGLWVGDYTIQPENGGMSVFAHEYGHDLGLPDLYDTNGGENSVNYWSIMAQSRVDGPKDPALGTRAADFGAWDKLQLGWLDYETVLPRRTASWSSARTSTTRARPRPRWWCCPRSRSLEPGRDRTPARKSWWSGTGDDYVASMARSVTLPAGATKLDFQANYNIEADYDYAYVEVNPGTGWITIPGTATDPAANNGLTGDSAGKWVPLSYDLSPYAGKTVDVRIRYVGDGGVQGNDPAYSPGLFVGRAQRHRRRHTGVRRRRRDQPQRLDAGKFRSVGSTITRSFDNYYIASNRAYVSFDKYLQSGPYNFGYANTKPDFVERFPYQNGLLVSYWDTSQADNNTSAHPGEGLILPVDANPRPLVELERHPVASARERLRLAVLAGEVRLLHAARQRDAPTTSVARRPSRCSVTTRRTGTPRSPPRA